MAGALLACDRMIGKLSPPSHEELHLSCEGLSVLPEVENKAGIFLNLPLVTYYMGK
jgi:hypothetical protein